MGSEPKRYKVVLKPSAADTLASLSKKDQRLVAKRIDSLALEPRPPDAEKLDKNLYRIRSGNYRILYQVDDNLLKVLVVAIGDRKDVYRFLK